MNSLIIGSNGYFGRHLSSYLSIRGTKVMHYDIHPKSLYNQEPYDSLDIRNRQDFDKLPKDVDSIYFFPGLTGPEDSFHKYVTFNEININGLLHFLDWYQKSNCNARVIYPSSRLVYEGKKDRSLTEDSPKQSKSFYAVSKLAAEHALQAYGFAYDLSYTIFRTSIPYGNWIGNNEDYGIVGKMLTRAKMKEPLTIFGDGSQKRTFTHIEDICNIITSFTSIDKTNRQTYNIGGENLRLLDVANLIGSKYNVPVNFTPWPELTYKVETGDTVLDDCKLKEVGLANYSKRIQNLFDVTQIKIANF